MLFLYGAATLIYLMVGGYLYFCLIKNLPINKPIMLTSIITAMLFHASLLVPQIVTLYGLNLNIFNAISLTSLFFLVFYVLFGLYRPILSLGVLALPTAIIGISVGYFGVAPYHPLTDLGIFLQIHILLSFMAYCVLLMTCVQAIILRLQIRELKHQTRHRFWVSKLPSLQSMESLLFDLILLGFVLLSLALGFGFGVTYDILKQHIAHKLFFSLASWIVFGIFIIGHYKNGWRGKKAANFAIYGFVLLAVGFFGSKIVLELILG